MIRVVERIPPLPWEPGYWAPWLRVGFETGLAPEAGPLELLRSIWPERYVRWDPTHQLWEVRQLNPVTGQDERVELLYRLARSPDGFAVPAYLPFTHQYVEKRARERSEFLRLGPKRYLEHVDQRNEARSQSIIRGVAGDMAAGLKELRRYFPVLAGVGEKIPLVGVAIDLRRKPVTKKGLLVCPS